MSSKHSSYIWMRKWDFSGSWELCLGKKRNQRWNWLLTDVAIGRLNDSIWPVPGRHSYSDSHVSVSIDEKQIYRHTNTFPIATHNSLNWWFCWPTLSHWKHFLITFYEPRYDRCKSLGDDQLLCNCTIDKLNVRHVYIRSPKNTQLLDGVEFLVQSLWAHSTKTSKTFNDRYR